MKIVISIALVTGWNLTASLHHFSGDAMHLSPVYVPIIRVLEDLLAHMAGGLNLREVLDLIMNHNMTFLCLVTTDHADMHVAVL